jgi:hypothetical protein
VSRAEAAAQRKARAAAAKHVADLEKQVAASEVRLREIEARLVAADLYRYPMEAEILGREHQELSARLAELYREWEAAIAEPAAATGVAG